MMSAFVAVVDAGGLSAAARQLRISTSVVTRCVSELENLVGAQLLIRTTRRVRVTDAGAQYAASARRVLQDVAAMNEAAGGAQAAPRGHLVVTAPALFGRMRVVPVVTEYLRTNPETTVTCLFVDRVVNLVDEDVDVAIRIGHLGDSALYATRVGEVRQVVCASPAYLARHGRPATPAELGGHCIVTRTSSTAVTEWRFAGAPSLRLAPRLATTTNDSAIEAALAGFGIVRVLSYQVAPLVDRGALEILLQPFEPAPLPVHVLHAEGRRASRKVRAFVELAAARLGTERTDAVSRGAADVATVRSAVAA
jgi:DNA-binding transcriptional LysR family regulator